MKTHGLLTVRFEMPFAIWCLHCSANPALIGQGVRFNAEKSRVGAYHTTPIWRFRMRHAACGGAIEIETDPARTQYVVVSGARRRDYGDGEATEEKEGLIDVRSEEEKKRIKEDAMAGLEAKKTRTEGEKGTRERIELLVDDRRGWEDVWSGNRRIRRHFREGRKEREAEGRKREKIASRLGVGVEMIGPEDGSDVSRAKGVEFGERGHDYEHADADADADLGKEALRRALFQEQLVGGTTAAKMSSEKGKKMSKVERRAQRKEMEKARRREELARTLRANSRAAVDPFLVQDKPRDLIDTRQILSRVKRSRRVESGKTEEVSCLEVAVTDSSHRGAGLLVDYDSE